MERGKWLMSSGKGCRRGEALGEGDGGTVLEPELALRFKRNSVCACVYSALCVFASFCNSGVLLVCLNVGPVFLVRMRQVRYASSAANAVGTDGEGGT